MQLAFGPDGLLYVSTGDGGDQAGDPDRLAPLLRIHYRGTQRLRRLRVRLRASEDAVATIRAQRFRTRRVVLKAGVRRVVRLKATRRGARKLRRAIARRGRVQVTIRVAVRDADGNRTIRPSGRASSAAADALAGTTP